MKRLICLLLALLSLIPLAGCTAGITDHADFYYCTIDYQFGNNATVIQAESRDISGHEGELSYLISLYLAGPSSKKLQSPFPRNTKLVSVTAEGSHIAIELSYLGRQITDSEFILACACLTLSTMEFTEAEQVTISSGEKSITMERSDLLLYDTITSAETTTEETQ